MENMRKVSEEQKAGLRAKIKEEARTIGRNDKTKKQNEKNHPMPPLDEKTLSKRAEQGFSTANVTLISIIQGVTFGILVLKTIQCVRPSSGQYVSGFLLDIIPFSVASFSLLIVVTHEYLAYIMTICWPPKLLDTAIPFCLGASEALAILFLDVPLLWWGFNCLFCLAGVFAYFNILNNTWSGTFGGNKREETYSRHKKSINHKIKLTFVLILLCFIGILVWWLLPSLSDWVNLLPVILFVSVLIYIIVIEERYLKELYETYGFTR